jgi:hypothetical protein
MTSPGRRALGIVVPLTIALAVTATAALNVRWVATASVPQVAALDQLRARDVDPASPVVERLRTEALAEIDRIVAERTRAAEQRALASLAVTFVVAWVTARLVWHRTSRSTAIPSSS